MPGVRLGVHIGYRTARRDPLCGGYLRYARAFPRVDRRGRYDLLAPAGLIGWSGVSVVSLRCRYAAFDLTAVGPYIAGAEVRVAVRADLVFQSASLARCVLRAGPNIVVLRP